MTARSLGSNNFLPRRGRVALAGRVQTARVGTYLAAVAFGGFVAAAFLSGCEGAPAYAHGAPLTTPDLNGTHETNGSHALTTLPN